MARLALQRCSRHPEREAHARCPECTRFYCRECTTEHDERILCTDCLKALLEPANRKPSGFRITPIFRLTSAFFGLISACVYFYLVAKFLTGIPATYHDGSILKTFMEEMDK